MDQHDGQRVAAGSAQYAPFPHQNEENGRHNHDDGGCFAHALGFILAVALGVGLVVSLFQAMTSIQEMTLSVIPKMLAVAALLLLLAPWMIEVMTDFSAEVFRAVADVSH